MSGADIWHIMNAHRTITEVTGELLCCRIVDDSVDCNTLVCRPGMIDWKPAGIVPELFAPPVPPLAR